MRSIRSRLLLWLLLGVGCLWLLGTAGALYSYRSGLLAGVETELIALSRQVRMTQMQSGNGPSDENGPSHRGRGSGYGSAAALPEDVYWQVWWAEQRDQPVRSANLTGDLPRLASGRGENTSLMTRLEDGTSVMVSGGRYGMGEMETEISVAKSLEGVNAALLGAFGVALGVGGLFAGLAALGVVYALGNGLAPLSKIADQVAAVKPDSLQERFALEDVPEELSPVVERLNGLMERMERSFERERRFSSDLAHEMRTPVAELRLQVESAIKWPDEGGIQAWETALESVDRIEGIVQAMLRLARVEQHAGEDSFETIELSALVESLWAGNQAQAEARGIRLRASFPVKTTVRGDPDLWRHLLGNLLSNSAAYADPGSEVEVAAESGDGPYRPVIRVANAASRLSAEDATHLFERFWRGQGAEENPASCGLGLSLAKACAAAMGLSISAWLRPESSVLEIRIQPLSPYAST